MKNKIEPELSEATKIAELLSELNNKVRMDDTLSYISDEQYDQLATGIKELEATIYNHKLFSDETHDRMDELTDIMTSIANLDFSKKASVTGEQNHLDYIAIGLNLMSAQLKKQSAILKLYGNIIENSKDMVVAVDMKGKIEYLNKSAAEKLGYAKDELLSKPSDKIFPFHKFLKEIRENSGNAEIKFCRKNNETFKVAVTGAIVNNPQNEPENIILYCEG